MKIDNPKAFQNPELNRSVGCAKLDSSSLQCSEGRNEVNLFIIKTHILTTPPTPLDPGGGPYRSRLLVT